MFKHLTKDMKDSIMTIDEIKNKIQYGDFMTLASVLNVTIPAARIRFRKWKKKL